MKKTLTSLLLVLSLMLQSLPLQAQETLCPSANIFSRMLDQICWSCLLPFTIAGIGSTPDGAASGSVFCNCDDQFGVPNFGLSVGYWSPQRLVEVVRTPWCVPSLGGIQLQDSYFELGTRGDSSAKNAEADKAKAFYQYHYFSYPVMDMLEIFLIPECQRSEYVDFDMLYLSEIDPTWNNDLLAFILNPEAVIFANPLAQAMCVADCGLVTAGSSSERNYFCAGCDGTLYPLTGNISAAGHPVRDSSLIATRSLAALHRRGLARKTMGEDEMCKPTFAPMIPKSQYKWSMIFPKPEADGNSSVSSPRRDASGNIMTDGDGNAVMQSIKTGCCHNMGDSVYKWASTGRHIPGVGEDFVYLLYRWTDCCMNNVL